MNFLEKLDSLMEKFELNKRSLSQKSNIPYTTIDGWYKKGYEGLKLSTLRKLAAYFNTTLDFWVVDEITDPNYGKCSGFTVDYAEMEHIKLYRSLDAPGKAHIDTAMQWESTRTEQLREQEAQIQNSSAPVYMLNAAHERTDIEVTDEMRQQDDDTMNDDSQW